MPGLGQRVAALMDAGAVERLAALENRSLAEQPPLSVDPAGPGRGESGLVEGWTAYWPLGAEHPTDSARLRATALRVIRVTSSGSTLLVSFVWTDDPVPGREFLLPLDLGDWPADDLQVASGNVLKALLRATFPADWHERSAMAVSARLAVVIPGCTT